MGLFATSPSLEGGPDPLLPSQEHMYMLLILFTHLQLFVQLFPPIFCTFGVSFKTIFPLLPHFDSLLLSFKTILLTLIVFEGMMVLKAVVM